MAGPFDFAVVGSSTLSLLLCGLLARDHGARVARIGRRPSSERLPRGPDLALLSATRAVSWRILRDGDAETRRLLAALGAEVRDVDVEVVADAERTRAALDHIAHIAAGYRQQVRQAPRGWSFRGVTHVLPQAALLTGWLDQLGVEFVDADTAPLAWNENGVAHIAGLDAGQIVLADDDFILDLDVSVRPPTLRVEATAMTLLDRAPGRGHPLRLYPDRLIALIPRDATSMLARVGRDEHGDDRLASALDAPFPVRRLATARYRTLASTDGAPVIGPLSTSGLFVIAGLDEAGPFFAPALARHLRDRATQEESSWVAAHAPASPRAAVAEFAP